VEFFGLFLLLPDGWRPVVQGAVRPELIVILPPRFNHASRLLQADKPFQVQALVAQLAVE
jgi:hypothetical protein